MAELAYKDFTEHTIKHFKPHIRFKGVWDMQDLYEFMIDYLRSRRYKFHEKIYKHKHPSPYGVERQYIWHAEKRETDVYTFYIDIYIHTYDAQDIQVKLKDGSIKTFTKGRMWMEVGSGMELFDDERWARKSLWASLKMFLNNYIYRKKHGWDVWDIVMYREVQKLVWLVRRRLKMEYDEYEQKYWTGVHA